MMARVCCVEKVPGSVARLQRAKDGIPEGFMDTFEYLYERFLPVYRIICLITGITAVAVALLEGFNKQSVSTLFYIFYGIILSSAAMGIGWVIIYVDRQNDKNLFLSEVGEFGFREVDVVEKYVKRWYAGETNERDKNDYRFLISALENRRNELTSSTAKAVTHAHQRGFKARDSTISALIASLPIAIPATIVMVWWISTFNDVFYAHLALLLYAIGVCLCIAFVVHTRDDPELKEILYEVSRLDLMDLKMSEPFMREISAKYPEQVRSENLRKLLKAFEKRRNELTLSGAVQQKQKHGACGD